MSFFRIAGLLLTVSGVACAATPTLWYREPAQKWEEALPVGNGRLGAMVHGGVRDEVLQLNESSVWSGQAYYTPKPAMKDNLPRLKELLFAGNYADAESLVQRTMTATPDPRYGSYKPLADLRILFDLPAGTPTVYRRQLDLDSAIAETTFTLGGAIYTRQVFASAPAQLIAVRLSANRPGLIGFRATLGRDKDSKTTFDGLDRIVLKGETDNGGVRFHAVLQALPEGGTVTAANGELRVVGATAVTLLLAANTDFQLSDPMGRSNTQLLSAPGFPQILAEHLTDYRKWFRRVSLSLDGPPRDLFPTGERIRRASLGDTDPALAAIYFQYGRYLLISSSRPGGLPANLQGIWNPFQNPPGFSDYPMNIATEMNYWLAGPGNLAELEEPLFDFAEGLREAGRRVARERFGARGLAFPTRTNIWGNVDLRGSAELLWYDGAAWLAHHFEEHYQFTGDKKFLRARAWPMLREASEFYFDTLTEDPKTRALVTGPATSPENRFQPAGGGKASVVMGPSMSLQIVRQLFQDAIKASETLGVEIPFRGELESRLKRLAPIAIGSRGQVLEWPDELVEIDSRHAHLSPLFALFPGEQIDPAKTPDLAAAARKTLELRGDPGPGWSTAWKINLWARLHDGKRAQELLQRLMANSTLPNLLATNPPFQIGGNLGGAAGIAEMLLQSKPGELDLLPALPPTWPTGTAKGLRTRGCITVDLDWKDGKLRSAGLRGDFPGSVNVRYGGIQQTVKVTKATFRWVPILQ